MKIFSSIVLVLVMLLITSCNAKELTKSSLKTHDWEEIKTNATFIVPDASYDKPYIQPLNVGGWEDGLYISRDGLELYAYYMPVDVFSLYAAREKNPVCFDYQPYYRSSKLGVDMNSNPWGCKTFFQGDIIIATRNDINTPFTEWQPSNLQRSISNEGAPCGVLKDTDTYDVFVFTQNRNDIEDMEIMFLKDTPRNPNYSAAVPIVSSTGVEDNPHIERLKDGSLVLFFDRDRHIYYAISTDNGTTWSEAVLIKHVLNDQAPYDIQPHLWNDGKDWFVYFCRDNNEGLRSIFKSKQQVVGDWDSWGEPELVIKPGTIKGGHGTIIGIGEPSLTSDGGLSFVVIYGDLDSKDPTDVFDCDPWFLPKKK